MNPCKCGGTPEWVKLWESKRYGGFIRCPKCGRETRVYVSKQNAVKAWNRGDYDGKAENERAKMDGIEPDKCESCIYYPPSALDGKPCCICDPEEDLLNCYCEEGDCGNERVSYPDGESSDKKG